MEKYVLHFDFHAIDMANVDIVLGYPWMDLVYIVNINVQKKFIKLWFKKKKITLEDVSLIKTEGPMAASTKVLVESEVQSVVESTKGDEEKP
jgi:hypothetical protein